MGARARYWWGVLAVLLVCGTVSAQGLSSQDIAALRAEVAKAGGTYTVGQNSATVRSLDQLCGFDLSTGHVKAQYNTIANVTSSLPSSYDWRSLNGVTPIRDQGQCGSCWAFGSVGPFESVLKIKGGVDIDLSEQYLVNCNPWNWGCNGGNWAQDMLVNPGAVLESACPYQAANGSCGVYAHPYQMTSWGYVGSSSGIPAPELIKAAIYKYGPVGVAVYVGRKFQAYTGGIFNTSEGGAGKSNHCVVLTGWDDANGCWVMRNSWGTGWGEQGYMRIKYGISNIGLEANYALYGAPIQVIPPTTDIVVDNTDAGFKVVSGKWITGVASRQKYDLSYVYNQAGTGKDKVQWQTEALSGNWAVYVEYPQGTNRAPNAPFTVTSSAGNTTFRVDQRINGGQWNYLGTFPFNSLKGTVVLTDAASSGYVVADAVRFTLVP